MRPKLKLKALCLQLFKLSSYFELTRPDLRIVETDTGAAYYPGERKITLPLYTGEKRSHEVRLLHEFAHYLAHSRTGKPQLHRLPFVEALWDVVMFWYGDPTLYPWHTDFVKVEKYALSRMKKEGYAVHTARVDQVPR